MASSKARWSWQPQTLDAAAPQIAPLVGQNTLIVSIMAGEDKLLTSWRLKADRSAFDEEPVGTTE